MSRVASVNLAGPQDVVHGIWSGRKKRSGIGKRPVTQRVATGRDHLQGDTVCDRRHHGGVDKAVYAYAGEDAQWWSDQLGRPLGPGAFGENLTTAGLDVNAAVIGERWAIGSAVLEVSCPRTPCRVFAGFWDVADLVKTFTRAGRPGAYLRVAEPGEIGPGDTIVVADVPVHGLTIAETFRALTGDRSLAARLLEAPQLPAQAHASARAWLASAGSATGSATGSAIAG